MIHLVKDYSLIVIQTKLISSPPNCCSIVKYTLGGNFADKVNGGVIFAQKFLFIREKNEFELEVGFIIKVITASVLISHI